MKHAPLLTIRALCVLSFATIFNGSSQDVPVSIPDGTVITDSGGLRLPIRGAGKAKYINLRRNREYYLQFVYRDDSVYVHVPKSMNGWWVLADLYAGIYPIIVDALTGAWNSFDGIQVVFPDSKESPKRTIYLSTIDDEDFDPDRFRHRGMIILLGMGFAGPTGGDQAYLFLLGNSFTYGLGYQLFPSLHLLAEVNESYIIDVHPAKSDLSSEPVVTPYELRARYLPSRDFYVAAGMGVAQN